MHLTGPAAVRDGYRGIGEAWSSGPATAYERLTAAAIAHLRLRLWGLWVLDLGAGTGAVSRCVAEAGGRPVALDASHDMLRQAQWDHARADLSCAVGDGEHLPFADACFDAVIAAFSLSHIARPLIGLQQARRVLRPGGHLVSLSFVVEDAHPAKALVDRVAERFGFCPPAWYAEFKHMQSVVDTPRGLGALATSAGLVAPRIDAIRVDTGVSTAADLVRWRLGMAHIAPFVAALSSASRQRLIRDAVDALGPAPQPWRPSVLILSSRAPA